MNDHAAAALRTRLDADVDAGIATSLADIRTFLIRTS